MFKLPSRALRSARSGTRPFFIPTLGVLASFVLLASLLPITPGLAQVAEPRQEREDDHSGSGARPRQLAFTPNEGVGPEAAVSGLEEVIDKRSRNVKVFRDPGGGDHIYQIFAAPVHFKDGSRWREIKPRLVPAGGGYETEANSFDAFFPIAINRDRGPRVTLADGASLEVRIVDGRSSAGSVDGDRITYPDALAHADVRYVSTATGYAEHVILESPEADEVIEYEISTEGLELIQLPTGEVAIVDGDIQIGLIPRGVAEESLDGVVAGGGQSVPVEHVLEPLGPGRYALTAAVSRAWLDDPATTYPVLVDPMSSSQMAAMRGRPGRAMSRTIRSALIASIRTSRRVTRTPRKSFPMPSTTRTSFSRSGGPAAMPTRKMPRHSSTSTL